MTAASLALVLGSMLLMGTGDFVYKRVQVSGVHVATYMLVQALAGSVFAGALVFYVGAQVTVQSVLFGLGATLTFVPGQLLLLRSLRRGDATINVPIYRLSFILTAVGAIVLLSEPAGPMKVVALVLATASVLCLSNVGLLRKGQRVGGLGSLLLGALFYAGSGLVNKSAMAAGILPVEVFAVQAPASVLFTVVFAMKQGPLKLDGQVLRNAPLTAAMFCTSALLLLTALQTGEASVVVPIVQLSFVCTAALAVVFLREQLTRRKALGIGLAICAVVVFAL